MDTESFDTSASREIIPVPDSLRKETTFIGVLTSRKYQKGHQGVSDTMYNRPDTLTSDIK